MKWKTQNFVIARFKLLLLLTQFSMATAQNSNKSSAYYVYVQKYDTLRYNTLSFNAHITANAISQIWWRWQWLCNPTGSQRLFLLSSYSILIHVDNFWRRAEINKYMPRFFTLYCSTCNVCGIKAALYLGFCFFVFVLMLCTVYLLFIFTAVLRDSAVSMVLSDKRQMRPFVIWTTSWQLATNWSCCQLSADGFVTLQAICRVSNL